MDGRRDGWMGGWVDGMGLGMGGGMGLGMGGGMGLRVGFININDMYNNDVGQESAQKFMKLMSGCGERVSE